MKKENKKQEKKQHPSGSEVNVNPVNSYHSYKWKASKLELILN